VRRATRIADGASVAVGDIGSETRWAEALEGVDFVLHLAAHVHHAHASEGDFRRVNVDGTRRLAEEAARLGVRRFVFVSSIKVNGEATNERPFTEGDAPAPVDAYGRSKRDAEASLWRVAAETGLEVVVVRPPLVYGPGAGGNLRRLMALVSRGLPLPLSAIRNRRSFVGVANFTDLIALCLDHPAAAGETFLAADEPALSTPRLLHLLADGLGAPVSLFPAPFAALRLAAALSGRQDEFGKLSLSLEVDATKARTRLGWVSALSVEEGLREMACRYAVAARS
jgi:nucleoside-diphosphate-sugar epimerase